MKQLLIAAVRDEDAASMLEYAVLLLLVALVALSALELLGGQLNTLFSAAANIFRPSQAH